VKEQKPEKEKAGACDKHKEVDPVGLDSKKVNTQHDTKVAENMASDMELSKETRDLLGARVNSGTHKNA